MRGHSRSRNGVASLAYDPRIHPAREIAGHFRKAIHHLTSAWIAGSSPAMTT
jgi:hypothetical protein